MTLDWQVLLMALVAISLRLVVLATSLQPEEQLSQLNRAAHRSQEPTQTGYHAKT
jgi:hypothetical protein